MSWLLVVVVVVVLQVKGLRSLYNQQQQMGKKVEQPSNQVTHVPRVQLKTTTAPATTNCYRKLSFNNVRPPAPQATTTTATSATRATTIIIKTIQAAAN